MWLPTKAQVDAASRHAMTAAGVAVAIFGLQAKGISVEQVQGAIRALGDTVNTILILLGAAGGLYASLKAGSSASPTSQIAKVAEIAQDPALPQAEDAQAALVQATSAIAQNKILPKSDEAKNALIAATVALDEVQGIVADRATAAAIPSSQVMSADSVKIISNESGLDTNRGRQ